RRTVEILAEDFVERLFHGSDDRLAVVDRDHHALQQEQRSDRRDQRWHAEPDGDDAVDDADQNAKENGRRGAEGKRQAQGDGEKHHHIGRERERAADGYVDLAGDHQHDFGDGDQAVAPGVAEDDAKLLRGQERSVAAPLEVHHHDDGNDRDAGFPVTRQHYQ